MVWFEEKTHKFRLENHELQIQSSPNLIGVVGASQIEKLDQSFPITTETHHEHPQFAYLSREQNWLAGPCIYQKSQTWRF